MSSNTSPNQLRHLKTVLLATSMLALGGSQAVYAQAAAAAGTASNDVETVVVTGSHLGTGFTSPTPVTVQDSADLAARAPSTISDALNQLPEMRQTSTNTQAPRGNGGGGVNSVDLRGLGVSRTLLLVDGKRIGTADLNVIPTNLVDRIEVVTGGASAAYGSDAVAGVVNFITKTHIDGIQGSFQYGESQRGDNIEPAMSFAAGSDFFHNRMHVVIGGDFSDNHGVGTIYSNRRDDEYGDATPNGQWCSVVNPANHGALGLPATSLVPDCTWSTQAAGSVIVGATTATGAANTALNQIAFGAGGVPYNFQLGTVASTLMYGGPANPSDPHGSPNGNWLIEAFHKRDTAYGKVTFDIDEDTSVYLQYSYGQNGGSNLSTFHQETNLIVPVSGPFANPFVPASIQAIANANNLTSITIGKQEEALGGYQFYQTDTTNKMVIGANGKIFGDWSWDVAWDHNQLATESPLYTNVLEGNYIESAFAVNGPNGVPVCGNVANNPNLATGGVGAGRSTQLSPGCQPFNIFGPTIDIVASQFPQLVPYATASDPAALLNQPSGSLQAADYFLHTTAMGGFSMQDVWEGNIHGSPFSDWAGPVQVAAGIQHRRQGSRSFTDYQGFNNYSLSNNGSDSFGSFQVTEGYVEFGVPLLKNAFLAQDLGADLAVREIGYSQEGNRTTWKFGLNDQVDDTLRVRASVSRDVREPTTGDLFNPQTTGITASFSSKTTGLSGPEYTIAGGNPNLKPETATSYVVGFVFTPTADWLDGFNASIDYFNTTVRGAISSVSAANTDTYCAQKLQNGFYCQFILPTGGPGGQLAIQTFSANLNKVLTDGMDYEFDYRVPEAVMGWVDAPGTLKFRWLTTWTDILATTTAVTRTDVAGSGIGGGVPNWVSNLNITYGLGITNTNLQFRYTSDIKADATLIGPGQAGYDPSLANSISRNLFPAQILVDLAETIDVGEIAGANMQVFFNVNNLLDKDAPGQGQALTAFVTGGNPYDLLGRTFKLGVRYKF